MKKTSFKLIILALILILCSICSYYYYHNYLSNAEIIILKVDNNIYKQKYNFIRKPQADRLIYQSRHNKFEETNFKVLDNYEKPQPISLDNSNKSIYDFNEDSSFHKIEESNNIKVTLDNNNNKKNIASDKIQSTYYIELGIFTSKEDANNAWNEIIRNSKKLTKNIPIKLQLVHFKDKVFVKLIIPLINSFNEARQICRIIKDYQSNCLIKNY